MITFSKYRGRTIKIQSWGVARLNQTIFYAVGEVITETEGKIWNSMIYQGVTCKQMAEQAAKEWIDSHPSIKDKESL